MSRVLLVGRLALRDLRRRRAEATLLLLTILAATTTLTLALVLRDAASDPYRSTREATRGPDVVAFGEGGLDRLAGASGVAGHSGPYPVAPAKLRTAGRTSDVQIVGRDAAPAAVDQPEVIGGTWVREGGVVVEAAFAKALGVAAGDPVTLNGRSFTVAGTAVTAAMAPYPGSTCIVTVGCVRGIVSGDRNVPPGLLHTPGLVWLTRADAETFGARSYVLNLKLTDPDAAQAFAEANSSLRLGLKPWPEILDDATAVARDSQILLLIGAWLLGLLAVAGLAVLVGGRMADQSRRVGLLKAVGGTPGLVAAVLLAEYVLVALIAAAAGLAVGSLTAPLLTSPGAGLLGRTAPPPLTVSTAAVVTAAALAVGVLATAVPAVRAARISTVAALADVPRPPRRVGWLVAFSARLPVPLLLAVRVAARRPRRAVLAVVSVAITTSGIHVVLILDSFLTGASQGRYGAAQVHQLQQVLLVWTVMLLVLAAVNAVVITWATVLDNRHTSALARALGATPGEVTTALAAAQVLPAWPARSWAPSPAATPCSPPSTGSPAATATGPRCRRSGTCWSWCWRPCSRWRR